MHRVPYRTRAFNLLVGLIAAVLLLGCSSIRGANQNSPKIYVDVTGSGKDQSSALAEAFRNAVREASGILISSKLELANETIVKDEVSEFSAGYISSYEVKKTYNNDGTFYVEIGALVSSSKLLSEYMFEKSAHGEVSGKQLYANSATYLRSKEQGDRLLQHLVETYPNKALTIVTGKVATRITENRKVWLIVPYRISWSKGFLDAFGETVGFLSQNKCVTGTEKNQRRCDFNVAVYDGTLPLGNGTGYTLSDKLQEQILRDGFLNTVGLKISILDESNLEIYSSCNLLQFPYGFIENNDSLILYAASIDGDLKLDVISIEILNQIKKSKA